jgi:hypothetical protein
VLKVLELWIMSWITDISKPYQFRDSFNKFSEFLKVSRSILRHVYPTVDELISSMEQNSSSWALCFKKDVMDLEQHTTSIGESLNSSLKKYKAVPMASLTLTNSAMTCIDHSQTFLTKRKIQNVQNNNKSRAIMFGDVKLNHLTKKAQSTRAGGDEGTKTLCQLFNDCYCSLISSHDCSESL